MSVAVGRKTTPSLASSYWTQAVWTKLSQWAGDTGPTSTWMPANPTTVSFSLMVAVVLVAVVLAVVVDDDNNDDDDENDDDDDDVKLASRCDAPSSWKKKAGQWIHCCQTLGINTLSLNPFMKGHGLYMNKISINQSTNLSLSLWGWGEGGGLRMVAVFRACILYTKHAVVAVFRDCMLNMPW